jgi:hypothetical protein
LACCCGAAYSIAEGEALAFKMGKRMVAANETPSGSRTRGGTGGFVVYDCAARALQAALVRPKGKLAHATKAVLRLTASRPCPPANAKWPTAGGVWAFEVIVPVAIAIEQQTWMEDAELATLWLPGAPAGRCKQCALGERTCVQVRNRLEMGAPPRAAEPRRAAATRAGGASAHAADGADADTSQTDTGRAAEWLRATGEKAEAPDFRSFV